MSSPSEIKKAPIETPGDIPVFQSASIRAMGPLSQEIAKLLLDAGYIKIIESKDAGVHG